MTKAEKIRKIQEVLELKNPQENLYADLLKTMGDLKTNYGDSSGSGEDEGCFECRSVIL